jgi:hypothetical protein
VASFDYGSTESSGMEEFYALVSHGRLHDCMNGRTRKKPCDPEYLRRVADSTIRLAGTGNFS